MQIADRNVIEVLDPGVHGNSDDQRRQLRKDLEAAGVAR